MPLPSNQIEPRTTPLQAMLLATLLILLSTAQNLKNHYDNALLLHIEARLGFAKEILSGNVPLAGPSMGESGLSFGGPLYYLLYAPLPLISNPVVGVHMIYLLIQLLALLFWVSWGLRKRLPPEVVWGSAIILAWKMGCANELAENATVFGFLTVPLFISIAGTLRHSRLAGMILPGFILAVCAMIHLAITMLLTPAIILGILLIKRQSLKRIGIFLGATLFALLPALHLANWPDSIRLIPLEHYGGDNAFLPNFLHWLHLTLDNPLWLAGIGLVAGRLLLGKRPAPYEILAIVWTITGALFVSLGHTLTWHKGPSLERLAALYPAQAILEAVVLIGLMNVTGSVLARFSRWKPGLISTLAALTAAALCVAGVQGARFRSRLHDDWDLADQEPPQCPTFRGSAYSHRLLQSVAQAVPLGGPASPAVLGSGDIYTTTLLSFSRHLPTDGQTWSKPRKWVFILPRLEPLSPRGYSHVHHLSPGFSAITGGELLDLREGEASSTYEITLPAGGKGMETLLISLVYRGREAAPRQEPELTIKGSKTRLKPLVWNTCGRSRTGLFRIPRGSELDFALTLTIPRRVLAYQELNALILAERRATTR